VACGLAMTEGNLQDEICEAREQSTSQSSPLQCKGLKRIALKKFFKIQKILLDNSFI
jgi:hypothetical protein